MKGIFLYQIADEWLLFGSSLLLFKIFFLVKMDLFLLDFENEPKQVMCILVENGHTVNKRLRGHFFLLTKFYASWDLQYIEWLLK